MQIINRMAQQRGVAFALAEKDRLLREARQRLAAGLPLTYNALIDALGDALTDGGGGGGGGS